MQCNNVTMIHCISMSIHLLTCLDGDVLIHSNSLAISELLEDGDDDSLGLGLGVEKHFTGVKLSGEKQKGCIENNWFYWDADTVSCYNTQDYFYVTPLQC